MSTRLATRLWRGLFGSTAPSGRRSGASRRERPGAPVLDRIPTVSIVLGAMPARHRLGELLAERGFDARVAVCESDLEAELDLAAPDLVVTTTALIGAVRRASAAPIVNLDIFFRTASAADGRKPASRFDGKAFAARLGEALGGFPPKAPRASHAAGGEPVAPPVLICATAG